MQDEATDGLDADVRRVIGVYVNYLAEFSSVALRGGSAEACMTALAGACSAATDGGMSTAMQAHIFRQFVVSGASLDGASLDLMSVACEALIEGGLFPHATSGFITESVACAWRCLLGLPWRLPSPASVDDVPALAAAANRLFTAIGRVAERSVTEPEKYTSGNQLLPWRLLEAVLYQLEQHGLPTNTRRKQLGRLVHETIARSCDKAASPGGSTNGMKYRPYIQGEYEFHARLAVTEVLVGLSVAILAIATALATSVAPTPLRDAAEESQALVAFAYIATPLALITRAWPLIRRSPGSPRVRGPVPTAALAFVHACILICVLVGVLQTVQALTPKFVPQYLLFAGSSGAIAALGYGFIIWAFVMACLLSLRPMVKIKYLPSWLVGAPHQVRTSELLAALRPPR